MTRRSAIRSRTWPRRPTRRKAERECTRRRGDAGGAERSVGKSHASATRSLRARGVLSVYALPHVECFSMMACIRRRVFSSTCEGLSSVHGLELGPDAVDQSLSDLKGGEQSGRTGGKANRAALSRPVITAKALISIISRKGQTTRCCRRRCASSSRRHHNGSLCHLHESWR